MAMLNNQMVIVIHQKWFFPSESFGLLSFGLLKRLVFIPSPRILDAGEWLLDVFSRVWRPLRDNMCSLRTKKLQWGATYRDVPRCSAGIQGRSLENSTQIWRRWESLKSEMKHDETTTNGLGWVSYWKRSFWARDHVKSCWYILGFQHVPAFQFRSIDQAGPENTGHVEFEPPQSWHTKDAILSLLRNVDICPFAS